ncbi:MAG TPA: sulfatase [Thermodesulfobacteriota bacterium]|nr:sulfatase [Thermodesulfobacteriota bacterium]
MSYNNRFKIFASLLIIGLVGGALFFLLNLYRPGIIPISIGGQDQERRQQGYRPNIILISIDTLRADHLGCYGYYRNTTPNIDRLAEDGVLFANTIAQSTWTLPSHMSIFTGLYVSSHGIISDDKKLGDEHITLAEVLQDAGYETVAFTEGGYVSEKFGYQGFDHFEGRAKGEKEIDIKIIYTKAVDWLKKAPSRPFFLFLHTYQPHSPYNPPPAFDIYSDKNYQGIVDVSAPEIVGNDLYYYQSIQSQMTLDDYLYVIDKYDGEIHYTDHYLGKLFNALKDLGLYDESIIIFTSDHGENFLDHPDSGISYIGHYEMYDEVVKVPLIIKAPGFPKNKIIDTQVESIDIMPTVLGLLKINITSRVEGESLVGLVKKGLYDEVFAFSERSLGRKREFSEYRMIRSNDWKLLLRSKEESGMLELELYNLKVDPKEQNNLHTEEVEVGKSMFAKLQTWMNRHKGKSKPADKIKLDDDLKKQLKDLGYIN